MTEPSATPKVGITQRPILWLVSTAISIALMIPIVNAADWGAVLQAFAGAGLWLLMIAIALQCVEGIFMSLRLSLFHGEGPKAVRSGFAVCAWYVVGIAYLPARLGEAVGAFALYRYFGVKPGGAVSSVLAQRLLDLFVLAACTLPAAIAIAVSLEEVGLWQASVLVAAAVMLLLLGWWLVQNPAGPITPLARWAARHRHNKSSFLRGLVRASMQARSWARHHYTKIPRGRALTLTVIKWVANIGSMVVAMAAAGVELSIAALAVLAILYNFLLAVPLPTLGGIGLGEVGIAALLTFAGVPFEMAAAAGLILRALFITVPLFFALVVWLYLAFSKRSEALA